MNQTPDYQKVGKVSCYNELQGLVVCGDGAVSGGTWSPGMVGIVVGIVVGIDGTVVGIDGIGGRVTWTLGIAGTVVGITGFGREGIAPAAVGGRANFGIGIVGIVIFGTAGMEGIGGSVSVVGTAGMEGTGGCLVGTAGMDG